MTDKVDPSPGSDGQAYIIAQTIENHGSIGSGWVVADGDDVLAGYSNSGLTGAPLGGFEYLPGSTSGLDPVFDTGEAFVGGAWIGRDSQTTYSSLAASTSGQTVYVGWDYNATDTVKIGLSADFDTRDPKVELWEFDTDASGITSDTDLREVGKTHEFGAPALGDGTDIGRFLMTAVASAAVGTEGSSTNELWRAAGSTSDLVMSINVDGKMHLAYNAYFDGSDWRYVVGAERSFKLSFGSDGIYLHGTAGGSADSIISWDGWKFGYDGFMYEEGNGDIVYDDNNREVPQARLGGPAGSLSAYPLTAGDIDDGSGSGLDADTLDGLHASEIGGGTWTSIGTFKDTNSGTTLSIDTGTLSTTYDQYRLIIYWEPNATNGTTPNAHLRMQINGIGASNYNHSFNDILQDNHGGKFNSAYWWQIAGTFGNTPGTSDVTLTCIDSSSDGYQFSNLDQPRALISQDPQAPSDSAQLVRGILTQDVVGIDRINMFDHTGQSGTTATGLFQLYGRNFSF